MHSPRRFIPTLFFCALLLLSGRASAQNGAPDSAFGTAGFAGFLDADGYTPMDLALDAQGRIYVLAQKTVVGYHRTIVCRFSPSGTPDLGFGTNGIALLSTAGEDCYAVALDIGPGNRVVAACTYFGPSQTTYRVRLAALNENGAPDSSFNTTGLLMIVLGTPYTASKDVRVLPSGKIILLAETSGYMGVPEKQMVTLRYLPGGTLDATFGISGRSRMMLKEWTNPNRLHIYEDGSYLVAGGADEAGLGYYFLARFGATGFPDTRFTDSGHVFVAFPTESGGHATSVTVQPDSGMVISGWSLTAEGRRLRVVRFLPDGSRDLLFSPGRVILPSNTASEDAGIFAQADGSLIQVLRTTVKVEDSYPRIGLCRFTPGGMVDSTYLSGGILQYGDEMHPIRGQASLVQEDGKILVAGNLVDSRNSLYVARFLNEQPVVGAVPGAVAGVPGAFLLEQNFPNPFNPSTVIRYTLQEATGVRLEVYTLLGQKVKTLVDETQAPGAYEVRLDGSTLSSGVYLYRLRAGTRLETRRMALVR